MKPFSLELWMTEHENGVPFNIAETSIAPMSIDELFRLCDEDADWFFRWRRTAPLTYGDIYGMPELRNGIASLYSNIYPDEILTTHGGTGGNSLALRSLVEPGMEVVCLTPCYQQLYEIPGAVVKTLPLRKENGYLPDIYELAEIVTDKTGLICINNPNNPTGVEIGLDMLKKIISIADVVGAWVLCDEVYMPETSVADIYDRGISVGSMSKMFSLPGLRLGWVATGNQTALNAMKISRDYDHISCGMLDEAIANIALSHADKILDRNRRIAAEGLEYLSAWVEGQPGLAWMIKPTAGTTALIEYELDMDSFDFCESVLREAGTLIVPGGCFGVDKAFRVGYACGLEMLKHRLHALSNFLWRRYL